MGKTSETFSVMAVARFAPVDVVSAPDLTITEYIGRVASSHTDLSACVATVRGKTQEAPQTPAFDEYVLVLEGCVEIVHDGQMESFQAGESFFLKRGTRVQWRWPGPCKYVPICPPAFSPENCGREVEDPSQPLAKTEESMARLRQLHALASASREQTGTAVSVRYEVTFGFYIGAALGVALGAAGVRLLRR